MFALNGFSYKQLLSAKLGMACHELQVCRTLLLTSISCETGCTCHLWYVDVPRVGEAWCITNFQSRASPNKQANQFFWEMDAHVCECIVFGKKHVHHQFQKSCITDKYVHVSHVLWKSGNGASSTSRTLHHNLQKTCVNCVQCSGSDCMLRGLVCF